jgi:DNA polymerase sigma
MFSWCSFSCLCTPQADDFIPLLDISQPTGTSTREQQQQQRKLGYQPPWLPRLPFFSSPMLRLHNEIVAFCQMLAPTAEEVASRAASLDSLREVSHW